MDDSDDNVSDDEDSLIETGIVEEDFIDFGKSYIKLIHSII